MKKQIIFSLILFFTLNIFAENKSMKNLSLLFKKYTFKKFKKNYEIKTVNSVSAGVRGEEIHISKTFQPYWKGKIKPKNIKKNISKSKVMVLLEKLENNISGKKYQEADKIIDKLLLTEIDSKIKEYLCLKKVIVKLALNKKLNALKYCDEYLQKFPFGKYKKDIISLKKTIYDM